MEDILVESLISGISDCSCKRTHEAYLRDCVIKAGALSEIPSIIAKYGVCHPFVLCDKNTYAAAGERVSFILSSVNIPYTLHVIEKDRPAPDEQIVGEAFMHCEPSCDCVIAVGGGVINDTCKIVAAHKNIPDIFVATAPSMDGFASATSSMERGGLKVSITSKCPECVICDTAVLKNAPVHMIRSGVGDMVAKYVSIVEWKIASVLLGEYYCDRVASIVKDALDVCIKNAYAAVQRDEDAIAKLCRGLVISGIAMNYTKVSRPASGMEHYISHIIDMRSLEFGTSADLHGIQCGVATLTTIRAYEKLSGVRPDADKALAYVCNFEHDGWNSELTRTLGRAAGPLIELEHREGKYDKARHESRLQTIVKNWDEITSIIRTLPSSREICDFMIKIGHPTNFDEIGLSREEYREAFLMAKDIRDKYVLGRLLFDLGLLENFAEEII